MAKKLKKRRIEKEIRNCKKTLELPHGNKYIINKALEFWESLLAGYTTEESGENSLKTEIPLVFKLECPECRSLSIGVVEVTGKDRKSIEGYCCLRCNKFFKKDEIKLRR